jgi:hypothetical protein
VIAVRVGQEHVIDRQRRQRTLAHVEAHPERRHLDVGREPRDREPGDGDVAERETDLLESVEVFHGSNLADVSGPRAWRGFDPALAG